MHSATRYLGIMTLVALGMSVEYAVAGDAPEAVEPALPEPETEQVTGKTGEKQPSLMDTLTLTSDFEQTAALYALLAPAGVQDIERYVEEAKSIASKSDRAAGLQIIYLRYLDLDPEGAIDHLLVARTDLEKNLINALFFSWSKFQLDRALRHSLELPSAELRQSAARAIIRANAHLGLDRLNDLAVRLGSVAAHEMSGLQTEIIGQMATEDPKAALDQVMSLPLAQRFGLIHTVIRKWAAVDAEGLLAFTFTDESTELGIQFRQFAMQLVAQNMPDKLLELIDTYPLGRNDRLMITTTAIQAIATTEPHRALNIARQIETPRERDNAVSNLVMGLSYQDPDAALAILESLDDPNVIRQAVPNAVHMMAQQDLGRAIEVAQKYRDLAPDALARLPALIAQADAGMAIEVAAELAESNANPEFRSKLIRSIADVDPVSAAALAEGLPASMHRLSILHRIGRSWFRTDPDSAIAWALSQAPRDRAEVLQHLANEAAQQNPHYAMSVVSLLPSKELEDQWVGAISRELSRTGSVREAVDWIEQYRDRGGYVQWMTQIVQNASAHSIDEALSVAELLPDEASYTAAMNNLVQSWSARDVDAAARWVKGVESALGREQWISTIAGQMARTDVDQAIRWVAGFRDSAERDPAYGAVFRSGYLTTAQADTLMRKIMSPEVRYQALSAYIANVARYDKREARRFVGRQTLNLDQQRTLVELIEGLDTPRPGESRIILD